MQVITKKALNEIDAYLENPGEAGAEPTGGADSGYTFRLAPERHPNSHIKRGSSQFPTKRATCADFNF